MNNPQLFSYLRKISPYVFEELVLDAFEKKGFRVIRNKRYSGDGGIDGRVYKGTEHFLVQCKRYKGYISNTHLKEFTALCRKSRCKGFFVHTGKTGRELYDMTNKDDIVTIISGRALVELLLPSRKSIQKTS